ncbi:hypothetical protein FA15DRAFT_476202 [Coprinopsis marcescibilis]|uniref:BZIP domain-containing protein n=1 Tax=Coprinopsis marcescibilis TaxID=230819 RepID=A0A5C3KTJ8_COPMA|nr:hypothetical protein FA15DRAFT_476202 [Coprinopsis marcescibilis]
MAHQPPALSMSQIIACDAPLLSPVTVSDSWDAQDAPLANFNYSYYNLQANSSHLATASAEAQAKLLKMRMSPEDPKDADQEPLCLPTSQVFELEASSPSRASSELSDQASVLDSLPHLDLDAALSTASKRSASPASGVAPKKRATMTSKDFIPPDVSGLSKREARLVKNRAAAFLSRQRKREEFETMEIRVAELEQENARLLALAKTGGQATQLVQAVDTHLASEVEQLRAQLAAAQKREQELSAKLSKDSEKVSVKVESAESYVPASPSKSLVSSAPNKTAASFGLMVLLCALPTLLSMPMQSAANFSVASPFSSSSLYSNFLPSDFDWSKTSLMDTDMDALTFPAAAASVSRKLEFAGVDTSELGDLGGLDISFDTSSTDNGKIRVRIHPSSSASSRAASPSASSSSKAGSPSPMDIWTDARSSFSSQTNSPLLSSTADPFLGIDYGAPFGDDILLDDHASPSDFGMSSEYHIPDSTGGKRRVRIALKSPPTSSSEGGEWEVQIC